MLGERGCKEAVKYVSWNHVQILLLNFDQMRNMAKATKFTTELLKHLRKCFRLSHIAAQYSFLMF